MQSRLPSNSLHRSFKAAANGAGARRALLVTRASAAAAPETTSRGLQGPVVSIVLPKHIFFGSVVKIVGSDPMLGAWNAAKSKFTLEWSDGDIWTGKLELPPGTHEFKCVIFHEESGKATWEAGKNRKIQVPSEPGILAVSCTWADPDAQRSAWKTGSEEDQGASLEALMQPLSGKAEDEVERKALLDSVVAAVVPDAPAVLPSGAGFNGSSHKNGSHKEQLHESVGKVAHKNGSKNGASSHATTPPTAEVTAGTAPTAAQPEHPHQQGQDHSGGLPATPDVKVEAAPVTAVKPAPDVSVTGATPAGAKSVSAHPISADTTSAKPASAPEVPKAQRQVAGTRAAKFPKSKSGGDAGRDDVLAAAEPAGTQPRSQETVAAPIKAAAGVQGPAAAKVEAGAPPPAEGRPASPSSAERLVKGAQRFKTALPTKPAGVQPPASDPQGKKPVVAAGSQDQVADKAGANDKVVSVTQSSAAAVTPAAPFAPLPSQADVVGLSDDDEWGEAALGKKQAAALHKAQPSKQSSSSSKGFGTAGIAARGSSTAPRGEGTVSQPTASAAPATSSPRAKAAVTAPAAAQGPPSGPAKIEQASKVKAGEPAAAAPARSAAADVSRPQVTPAAAAPTAVPTQAAVKQAPADEPVAPAADKAVVKQVPANGAATAPGPPVLAAAQAQDAGAVAGKPVVTNDKTAPEAKVVDVPPAAATDLLQSQAPTGEAGGKVVSDVRSGKEQAGGASQQVSSDNKQKGEPAVKPEAPSANKEAGAAAAAAPNKGPSNNIVEGRSWKRSGAGGEEQGQAQPQGQQQQQEKEKAGAASGSTTAAAGGPPPELPGVQFFKKLFGLSK